MSLSWPSRMGPVSSARNTGDRACVKGGCKGGRGGMRQTDRREKEGDFLKHGRVGIPHIRQHQRTHMQARMHR
jgi:hypothetical protein